MNTITNPKKCTFCDEPAAEHAGITLDPPVCARHEDLVLLIEAMERAGKKINLETVTASLTEARANAGGWTIKPEEVELFLLVVLEARPTPAEASV